MKPETTTDGVVTCKRHEAYSGMKFHAGTKYVRCCGMN